MEAVINGVAVTGEFRAWRDAATRGAPRNMFDAVGGFPKSSNSWLLATAANFCGVAEKLARKVISIFVCANLLMCVPWSQQSRTVVDCYCSCKH